uniref:Uncharacterized protein n=1 Tax=Rhizophora mucronata TaxID=61149 RepID=A0A2P2QXN8_RHIMU
MDATSISQSTFCTPESMNIVCPKKIPIPLLHINNENAKRRIRKPCRQHVHLRPKKGWNKFT